MRFTLPPINWILSAILCLGLSLWLPATDTGGINLLVRYPTALTQGDLDPDHARPWEFTTADIYRLSVFGFRVGSCEVQTGLADLGVGHCADGALWALVIPRRSETSSGGASSSSQTPSAVWLRFHPSIINTLFPSATVFADGNESLIHRMSAIATANMMACWQVDGKALIPEPKNMMVYIDTLDGARQFFVVDTQSNSAESILQVEPEQPTGVILAGQWPGYIRDNPQAMALSGNYAYVAAGSLQVIDISNPTQPKFVGVCSTGDTATGVAVKGQYAYLVDRTPGLSVIDISDPLNPHRVGGRKTAASPNGVALSGNYAYVPIGINGMEIIDISNPQLPIRAGIYPKYTSAVTISGNLAYVADETEGLAVVDVSNPQTPQRIGSLRTSSPVLDLAVFGNYAYAVAGMAGLLVIDVTDPAQPRSVGVYTNSTFVAQKVAVSDQRVVFASDSSSKLKIFDVADAAKPRLLGQLRAGSSPKAVAVSGTNAYVAGSGSGLEVISIADPAQPRRTSYYQVFGSVQEVAIAGDYACVADGPNGLQIISLTDPAHPQWIAGFNLDGQAEVESVAVIGTYACMADYASGIHVVDLAAAGGPRAVGFFATKRVLKITAAGSYVYALSIMPPLLHVIDMADPANPQRVGECDLNGGSPDGLAVAGNYAYAVFNDGLRIIDVSNPAQPQAVGTYETNWFVANGIVVSGTYVYVTRIDGLDIIDVSNPALPRWIGQYRPTMNGVPWNCYGVAVSGRTAYVATARGFDILDITTPAKPIRVREIAGQHGHGIAVNGDKICLAGRGDGLFVFTQVSLVPRLMPGLGFDRFGCRLSFSGRTNQLIHLERSGDLRLWEDWITVIANGKTQVVTDPGAFSHSAQFYRAYAK